MQPRILWIMGCLCIGTTVASVCEILHSPSYSEDAESECSCIFAHYVSLNGMDKDDAVILPF